MSHTPFIAKSYRQVRRISRRSGSNFYRSFWLLPHAKREAMCALYAFARVTDDLGDCHEPLELRSHWLDWWRRATVLNLSNPSATPSATAGVLFPEVSVKEWPRKPHEKGRSQQTGEMDLRRRAEQIFPALVETAHRYDIPSHRFTEIIDGVIADQQKTRFDTYEQAEHYCYLAASSVGLACLHIWGFNDPMPTDSAIDCGLAFQWTNILRDITEDAQRGRIYLPRQHYQQHGLSEDDLLSPRPDDRLSCLIAEEAQRASKLFDSGWGVWDSLHDEGRPIFSMMWRTYRRLLQRIADDPGSVLVRRVQLSATEKLGLASQHFISPLFHRLPVPPGESDRSSFQAN